MKPAAAAAHLRRRAAELGFDSCRIAAPQSSPEQAERLATFLAAGRHGTMDWLAEEPERRADPRALWPEVRAVVMLGVNYGPAADAWAALARPECGVVSVYARNRDYHDVIKGRLKMLGQSLAARAGGSFKVFVDTAPVMEKPLAARAGLGWQGKHTNLVSRDFGSWLFLGALFTTLELPPDAPESDHCGRCRACLDACPTDAFPAPYQIDPRRCVSYLTIEHKGPIDRALRRGIGNRIYGCDDCLAACPWNKFAEAGRETKLAARDDLAAPALADLAELDDAAFRARFSGSPIKRIGRDRFVRNVLIAIGNSGDAGFLPILARRLGDGSALVRGAAVWALARLATPDAFDAARARHLAAENDANVRDEWRLGADDI
ncbi:tRNA epoxyqueuosine(34) reductase QueG [Segnochrobactrum spirostomi]|uniref:tRNA epoxyqueuosine(34) reductase QueG n=1 Tax=Segnochrobactrum spirostomi TaxID=2608987 RepID=UPI001FE8BCF8|nr:tRNA epoxyqueuosine(34) reductase QueG [Segnochrobactrum spirostomi]